MAGISILFVANKGIESNLRTANDCAAKMPDILTYNDVPVSEIHTAETVEDAVDCYKRYFPDIIVADESLKTKQGESRTHYDLIREIKNYSNRVHVIMPKIIVYAFNTSAGFEEKALKAEAFAAVPKCDGLDSLADKITEVYRDI